MAKKTLKGLHKNPAELASTRLVSALNAQVGNEMHASLQYVSIAAHFDSENLPQLAAFFYRQAAEERDHALKFVESVVDVGGRVATPAVAPHTLIATPRRSGGKMRVIVDRVCGVSSAAPMPCTTRAAISISMLPARPHHSDAAVNTARPST